MRFLITITLLLLLAGCGPETTRPERTLTPETQISRLVAAGELQQAAGETLKLSRLYPDKAVQYQQKAAEIYLQAGDFRSAGTVLENIKTDKADELFYNRLLGAEVALGKNNPARALTLLNLTPPPGTENNLIARYYDLRIQACTRQGNLIDAVRNRISMLPFLANDDARSRNNRQIWTTLNQMSLPSLRQYHLSSKPELASWLELAIINKTMFFKPDRLQLSLSLWKEQYPNHPANKAITNEILLASTQESIRPAHIALCLPLSGLYEWASQAIRDGFLAAWFTSTEYKPVISVYDCDAMNIKSVYRQAITEGADFVVGPLEKNAISNLLANNEITVTTLALNQIDTPMEELNTPENGSELPKLIQFGLSPEDEAQQVAVRAKTDGYTRALVITPNNDRGQRLFNAFSSQWDGAGGTIMEHIKYPENTGEYKTWVKSLLNANSSDKRTADLRNRLGRTLESETRLRGDADVIFMAASPDSARRIVPEFRFYQTGIPIYSTSDIFTGIDNPQLDKDLDGVIFNQIPWILDPEEQDSFLQKTINKLWTANKSAYREFYALGIDAYRLIPHLRQLYHQDTVNYPGETGELSLSKDGRIRRKLMWAKFSDGTPVVLKNQ